MTASEFLVQLPVWLLAAVGSVLLVILAFITLIQGRTLKVGPVEIGGRAEAPAAAGASRSAVSSAAAEQPSAPAGTPPTAVLVSVPRGDIGHGISLGGVLHDRELRVFGSPWRPWSGGGEVRSGFLYEADDSELACPVAAFKVHVHPNGTGRFHIVSMASPPHTMWFQAPWTERRRQLCYFEPRGEARPDWSEKFTFRPIAPTNYA